MNYTPIRKLYGPPPQRQEEALLTLLAEEEMKPAIHGVVTILVKEARKLQTLGGPLQNTYVRIQVRNYQKRTGIVSTSFGNPKWYQAKHIPLLVMRNRKHPFNLVRVSVHSFDADTNLSHNEHHEIGSVSFHLHDMLKVTGSTNPNTESASYVEGTFDLWNKHQMVGELDLKVVFNYGMFGYGYSTQINTAAEVGGGKGKEEESAVAHHYDPAEKLRYSLFPRLKPPADRIEGRKATLVPRFVKHPDVIPFERQVVLGIGKEYHDEAAATRECDTADFELVKWKTSGRLEQLKDEYFGLPSRFDRLKFLHHIVTSSTRKAETVKDSAFVNEAAHVSQPVMKYMTPTSTLPGVGTKPSPDNPSLFQLHSLRRQANLTTLEEDENNGPFEKEEDNRKTEAAHT